MQVDAGRRRARQVRRGLVIGALGVASSLLTACSTGEQAAGAEAARATPATSGAAVARPGCATDAGGDFVTATTSTGDAVGILVIGDGAGGLVLGPQDDGDICQWLPYATRLATRYRVALYDWADPRTEVPALAVAALRDAGAQQVVLGGASYGGAVALSEAYRIEPPLSGVLTLGGEITLPGLDGTAGIAQWTGPLLQLGSTDDDFFDSEDAEQLRALHPGDETIVMFPGAVHGVDLLDGHDRDAAWDAIDQFLAGVLG